MMANGTLLEQINRFNVFLAGERERMEVEEQKQKVSTVLTEALPLFDESKSPIEINEAFRKGLNLAAASQTPEALNFLTIARDVALAEEATSSRLKVAKSVGDYLGLPESSPESIDAYTGASQFLASTSKTTTQVATKNGKRVAQDIVTLYRPDRNGRLTLKSVPVPGGEREVPDEFISVNNSSGFALVNKTTGEYDFINTRTKEQMERDQIALKREQRLMEHEEVSQLDKIARQQNTELNKKYSNLLGAIMGMEDSDDYQKYLEDRGISKQTTKGNEPLRVEMLLQQFPEIKENPGIQEALAEIEVSQATIDYVSQEMRSMSNKGRTTIQPFTF